MSTVYVLTEDEDRLTAIETAVNALRDDIALDPLPGGDIRLGCIQVGLNAITDRNDAPNAHPRAPTLSIVGLPGSNDSLVFSDAMQARITAIATAYGKTEAEIYNLALHAGCLVMTGEAPATGYIADFG